MKPVTSSRAMRGFTLTELLIVVVIIGVLAAIALPAYQNYSRTSKRSDAHEGLTRMAQLQERFFTDNNTYATNATALGYATATPESNGGYWALSITQGGATYALQAAPTGGHQDPECLTITLNSAGQRGSTPPGGECWSGK